MRAGPRQSGQSEPCRIATTGKASTRTSQSGMGFTMDGFIEVLIERVAAIDSNQSPVSSLQLFGLQLTVPVSSSAGTGNWELELATGNWALETDNW